jgi:hypothetical protein
MPNLASENHPATGLESRDSQVGSYFTCPNITVTGRMKIKKIVKKVFISENLMIAFCRST